MRKAIIACIILFAVAMPAAFGQFRVDIGTSFGVDSGYLLKDTGAFDGYLTDLNNVKYWPVLNGGAYLQAKVGTMNTLKFAAGARLWSFGFVNVAYPAILVEMDVGPMILETSLGYAFGYFVFGNNPEWHMMDLFLPEASFWITPDSRKLFRVGAGIISAVGSGFDFKEFPYAVYAGVKVVVD